MATVAVVDAERLRGVVDVVRRHVEAVAVYAFGSRVEGRGDEWSDLDVAVFVEGAENWGIQDVARFCASVQKEAGDDVELHVFSAAAYRAPEPASFAAYIMAHGMPLAF